MTWHKLFGLMKTISSTRQPNDLSSDVSASGSFQMGQEMKNPGPRQKAFKHLPSSNSIIRLWHPGILLANLVGICTVSRFAASQNGEISVDDNVGIGITT